MGTSLCRPQWPDQVSISPHHHLGGPFINLVATTSPFQALVTSFPVHCGASRAPPTLES